MELSPDECYRALTVRDARFDGRFFTGVKTTGIYCRPICRVRLPLRQNVTFFSNAAAAEAAGFRACRRCRPDAAPSTPAWVGTSATVYRALRLISEGALDVGGLADLSERLGMGDRQLRRLFREHLGTTPLQFAQTRRAHFARHLIDSTEFPMSRIATITGFGSIRRFNEVMRKSFGCPPSELRKTASGANGRLRLRVSVRQPFSYDTVLAFIAPRAIPGIERVVSGCYVRTVSIQDAVGELVAEYCPGDQTIELVVSESLCDHLFGVVNGIRRLFDVDADLGAIGKQLRTDRVLRRAIAQPKDVRVPGVFDRFEGAIRAILGQQVSVKSATTLAGRLVERYGTPIHSQTPGLSHIFPRPERLCRARIENIGIPRQRADTIRVFARRVASGELALDASSSLQDTLEALSDVRGIGPWTANYLAMRIYREPDAFPAGDLGIRKALSKNGALLSTKQAELLAEAWRPWRAYAAMSLWQALGMRASQPHPS